MENIGWFRFTAVWMSNSGTLSETFGLISKAASKNSPTLMYILMHMTAIGNEKKLARTLLLSSLA